MKVTSLKEYKLEKASVDLLDQIIALNAYFRKFNMHKIPHLKEMVTDSYNLENRLRKFIKDELKNNEKETG